MALAIALSIGLTYHFVRNAYDTSHNGKDHPGGHDNSPSAEELRLPKSKNVSVFLICLESLDGAVERGVTYGSEAKWVES
ncbi:hypothetical protein OSTOST_24363 [Ostertagia ostertagi]